MKATKIILISGEASALICLVLLICISMTDYVRAAFAIMFAIVAVMIQSMQQDIKWSEPAKAENSMQQTIDECMEFAKEQEKLLNEMATSLNKMNEILQQP